MKYWFITSFLVVVVSGFPNQNIHNDYQSIQFDLNNDNENWSGHRRQPLPEPIGGNGRYTRPWNGRQGDKRSNNGRHTRPWNGEQEDLRSNNGRHTRTWNGEQEDLRSINGRHTRPWKGEQEDLRSNNGRHNRPWNGE